MAINGVRFSTINNCSIFYIDSLTDELKEEIKMQLTGIYNGLAEVSEMPDEYNLSQTLTSFLDRYNDKADTTKMGMIGEMLAHILINSHMDELKSLSILKNKEERSIKKGFDIIYHHSNTNQIWYSEVKSGELENNSSNSTDSNTILLGRSKSSILDMFESRRVSLWESALIDAKLVVEEGPRRIGIRNILSAEKAVAPNNNKRNVLLISVLYRDLGDEIDPDSLPVFRTLTTSEDVFIDSMIFSIQKKAYQTIADFLTSESTNHGT